MQAVKDFEVRTCRWEYNDDRVHVLASINIWHACHGRPVELKLLWRRGETRRGRTEDGGSGLTREYVTRPWRGWWGQSNGPTTKLSRWDQNRGTEVFNKLHIYRHRLPSLCSASTGVLLPPQPFVFLLLLSCHCYLAIYPFNPLERRKYLRI